MLRAGGWTVTTHLHADPTSTIYETTDRDWLIKELLFEAGGPEEEICSELENTLIVYNNRRHIRNCVAFPRAVSDFCGIERDHAWIALRRYDGPVTLTPGARTGPEFWQPHWKRLAVQVLSFLEDYHTVCQRVHMDIRPPNVLVNRGACQFVVSDFGLAGRPSDKPLREYPDDFLFYYLEMGGEPDEPIASWRMDLVSLGYMLVRLTWNPEMSDTFIERVRQCRRSGQGSETVSGLVALRLTEMSWGVGPLLRTYFDLLQTIGWTDKMPPPRAFYQGLAALFQ